MLLALAQLTPNDAWENAQNPLLRTVDIMEYISTHYKQTYAPNSRETIRRQTLHQFEQARLIDRNRDLPTRPTNSGDTNYSLTEDMLQIVRAFPDRNWREEIASFQKEVGRLQELYDRKRDLVKVPVRLPDGTAINLSAGKHNELQADIIHEFCSRFIGQEGRVIYVGDTAQKILILDSQKLEELGVPPMAHDKLPDVVVYEENKNWIFLIEAVTSHGPVSPKRWQELEEVFAACSAGRIYVTAFPDRALFRKYVGDIAWETEVWIADNPDHLIHFNGDRFLGPHL